jgi:hypothetical protein
MLTSLKEVAVVGVGLADRVNSALLLLDGLSRLLNPLILDRLKAMDDELIVEDALLRLAEREVEFHDP